MPFQQSPQYAAEQVERVSRLGKEQLVCTQHYIYISLASKTEVSWDNYTSNTIAKDRDGS